MIMTLNRLLVLCALVFLISACSSSNDTAPASLTGLDKSQFSHFTATAYTVCAQTNEGELKCFGDGSKYNFANGLNVLVGDDVEETGSGILAAQLGDDTVEYAMANVYFGCALYQGGVVKCWGTKDKLGLDDPALDSSDYVGDAVEELGNNLPIINLGTGLTTKQISLGDGHACAVLNNDRIKCWGNNRSGKLGYEDTDARGDEADEMGDNLAFVDLGNDEQGQPLKVKWVEAGYDRTCAILMDGGLKCWGANGSAQAGYGHIENIGDDPDEMGVNLPVIDLGTGRTVKQVFNYYVHTCAILDNDELKCWGSNADGKVGLASADNMVGNNSPLTKLSRCHNGSEQLLYERVAIEPGAQCTDGGIVYNFSLDANDNGEADAGEEVDGEMFCHGHDMNVLVRLEPILSEADLSCGGSGGYKVQYDFDNDGDGEFSNGTQNFMGDALPAIDFGSSSAVVDVVQGDSHTCALLADTTLKCWGSNSSAQLGLDNNLEMFGGGANETMAAQVEVDLGDDLYAVAIAGGYDFTCALLNNDQIKCWGYDNDYATLGLPEYLDEYIGDGSPEPEMGNALSPVILND
jgi:hypothetical protein